MKQLVRDGYMGKAVGYVGVLALAVCLGALAPAYGTMVVAGFLALGVAVLAYRHPQTAIALWIAVTVAIPNWTTVYVGGIGMPPASALGIPILLGIGVSRLVGTNRARISWMDWTLGLASVLVVMLWVTGDLQGFYFIRDLLLVWVLAYILGRNAGPEATKVFAIAMAVVAAWGIVEFIFGLHLFVNWRPSATHTLNLIQSRAGVDRSEAAFGHAIAYGASLAMAIPFAQQLRRNSLVVQILLAAGIVVSLSRGPLIALATTLVLLAWVTASTSKLRARYIGLTVIGASTVWFILDRMYSGVYADEVVSSEDSRNSQWATIEPALKWFSSALTFSGTDGSATVRGIAIIDSTPLRLAANFGIVAATLFLIPAIMAAWRVVVRKAGPASVALAGQIPVLAVTSFITQWQTLLFFVMGMAVTEMTRRSDVSEMGKDVSEIDEKKAQPSLDRAIAP